MGAVDGSGDHRARRACLPPFCSVPSVDDFVIIGSPFLPSRKGLGALPPQDTARQSGFRVAIPCPLGYYPTSRGVVHAGGVL